MQTIADIQPYLERAGLRRTKGRAAVLAALLAADGPLTIDELRANVRKVHVVTIYRVLRELVSRGIVYQTDLWRGKMSFELQGEHHHHITCSQCDRREDISVCATDFEQEAISQAKRFSSVSNHTVEFIGICDTCAR